MLRLPMFEKSLPQISLEPYQAEGFCETNIFLTETNHHSLILCYQLLNNSSGPRGLAKSL
jgi:hypothetical protein